MHQILRKLLRGVAALALSTACVFPASAADQSIFRFPSMLDDRRPEEETVVPAVKQGERSFRLVHFDDPTEASPSDLRIPQRPSYPGVSPRPRSTDPMPDPAFVQYEYAAESCPSACCEDFGTWMSNTELLFGADVFKNIGDSDGTNSLNNSFGLRGGFNTGIGLGASPVRLQAGGVYGAYDFRGRPDPVFDNSLEQQVFVTIGLYKRSDYCEGSVWSWGMVIDEFYAQRWGALAQQIDLAQLRGQVGYACSASDEVGAWCAVSLDRETATTISSLGQLDRIQAMDQFNLFWHRNWSTGADTTLYMGLIENADLGDWVVGATGRAPLSSKTALYGSVTYCAPHSGAGAFGVLEEAWNVSFGVLFYPGCKAFNKNVSGQRGLPLLPVAGNGTFLITP